jgi:hypothetical protein
MGLRFGRGRDQANLGPGNAEVDLLAFPHFQR